MENTYGILNTRRNRFEIVEWEDMGYTATLDEVWAIKKEKMAADHFVIVKLKRLGD